MDIDNTQGGAEPSPASAGSTTGLAQEIRRHLRTLSPNVRQRKSAQLLQASLKLHDAIAEFVERLDPWITASDQELRLRMGELSAQELRAVRSLLGAIERIGEDVFKS
jgi:hypothetical protein